MGCVRDVKVSDDKLPDFRFRELPYEKDTDHFIKKQPKKFSWSKARRIASKIVNNPLTDLIITFTPRPVRIGFNWIGNKLKTSTMIKDKAWYQSKTVWSAILIVVTAVLQALGVDVAGNPETMQTIYEVAFILAGAFGLVGLRAAIGDKISKEDN